MKTFLITISILGLICLASATPRKHRKSERFFGRNIDWFEASGEDDNCQTTPSTTTTTTTTTTVASEGGGEFDNFRAFPSQAVTVCQGASEGDRKCICYRHFMRRFFNMDYKLKCGSCSMSFVPDSRSSGGSRFGFFTDDSSEESSEEESNDEFV